MGNPLIGATVYWDNAKTGTLTNEFGQFTLNRERNDQLIVRFVGFRPDTITNFQSSFLQIRLEEDEFLDEVEVTAERQATTIDYLSAAKAELISEKELLKAACCNLSESFETNPSVDVSFTDAVTGTRQIRMLGLAGPYTQITRESMPDIRGLSSVFGLTYIPGPWIESIQLNKGAGTVINGYESIAGQINVELRKPEEMDRLYVNGYANLMSRTELNVNYQQPVTEDLSTAFLAHFGNISAEMDNNGDGFMDNPLGTNIILLNRWKLEHASGWMGQLGLKGSFINRNGGQIGVGDNPDLWGFNLKTNRLEGWAKLGKVFPAKPYRTFGLQVSGAYHDQQSAFGGRMFDARQQFIYVNFIYQDILGNTSHTYKTGVSFQYDQYGQQVITQRYDFNETVPGVFGEYSFTPSDKFGLTAGLRGDFHNLYGAFMTPRLHLRFAPHPDHVLRYSAGRGLRTAQIFAENLGLFSSSRQLLVESQDASLPFGLNPEIAWNTGLNYTRYFTVDFREGFFSVDYYYTHFQQQVVVDMDRTARAVSFYNLNGDSYAHSFQAQVDYELINRLDVRLAYRHYDVKTTYSGELRQRPLIAPHRSFINLAYNSRKHWSYDLTVKWTGEQRLPDTDDNPEDLQLRSWTSPFWLVHAQISKSWHNGDWEVYLGGENLLNYQQENAILASDQPFGEFFDASMIWAPVFGINVYAGVRYRIR